MTAPMGYRSSEYAATLPHIGVPMELGGAGAWLVRRAVDGTDADDAVGPYPLLCCSDWSGLARDLASHDDELLSVTCVTDPFGAYRLDDLRTAFPALVRPFKRHLVVDSSRPFARGLPSNHRRNITRAARSVDIELDVAPAEVGAEWAHLYANLVDRHQITGMAAIPHDALIAQLSLPGARVSRAVMAGETVAVQVWYAQEPAAYYHLGASSDRGYEVGASFALLDRTIHHLAQEVRWLDLGAGPGLDERSDDGLTRFKRPWANGSEVAYLCGRVGQQDLYDRLARGARSNYFPAYRAP